MKLRLLAGPALLLSLGAHAGDICGPHPRSWDAEHALIEETELTPELVEKSKKRIEEAKRAFCSWMAESALWPE